MIMRRGTEAQESERFASTHLESAVAVLIAAVAQRVTALETTRTWTTVRFDVWIRNKLQSIAIVFDPLDRLKITMEHPNDMVELVITRKH